MSAAGDTAAFASNMTATSSNGHAMPAASGASSMVGAGAGVAAGPPQGTTPQAQPMNTAAKNANSVVLGSYDGDGMVLFAAAEDTATYGAGPNTEDLGSNTNGGSTLGNNDTVPLANSNAAEGDDGTLDDDTVPSASSNSNDSEPSASGAPAAPNADDTDDLVVPFANGDSESNGAGQNVPNDDEAAAAAIGEPTSRSALCRLLTC